MVRGHGPKDSPGINYHLIVDYMILVELKLMVAQIDVLNLV